MESCLRRAARICATLLLAISGSPAAAQQAAPDSSSQQQQSVPPAPPPDLRGATEPTSAAPRHRWVEAGGYLRPEPRRKASTRRAPRRQATATPVGSKTHHAKKTEARSARPAKLTKAELRHCKGLTRRQLRRDSKCKAALQAEKKPVVQKPAQAKPLSKAEQRRCQKMSYSQLLRNKACAAMLQRELDAADRTKHRAIARKSGSRHTKADASRSRHQKSARHHRS